MAEQQEIATPLRKYDMQIKLPEGANVIGQFESNNIDGAFKELHDYVKEFNPDMYRAIRREGAIGISAVSDHSRTVGYNVTGVTRWGSGGKTFSFSTQNKKAQPLK